MELQHNNDALIEWNRLNNENAEQSFVSAIYSSMIESSPILDKFSVWLLAGTGITASFLITQINSILPHLSQQGFKQCLLFLVISAIFGFFSKWYALKCGMQKLSLEKIEHLATPIFEQHTESAEKIQELAKDRTDIVISEINMQNVIKEFIRPFPLWIRWLIARKFSGDALDRQAGYHIAVRAYTKQIIYTFLQIFSYLLFLITAFFYSGNYLT